ncbi:MAG: hypothetical protein RI885_440 [Actinomycetota bacterium]
MTRSAAAMALAAASLALVGCVPAAERTPPPAPEAEPARFAPAAPIVASSAPGPLPFEERADAAWLASTAAATGIPERALRAYASATLVSNAENLSCGASWNTLAGMGWVESQHGAIFDGAIGAEGTVSPKIFGVPLDGGDTANVPDSDDGAIDEDSSVDRAVGPLQLIPDTWRNWHVDADGDGVEDLHDLDDASLAAVHYLCRAGGELSTEEGWRAGILAWNRSETYLEDVAARAVGYAAAASG